MSFFNPKIYNYKNLKPKDKEIIQNIAYVTSSLELVSDDFENSDIPTISTIRKEFSDHVIESCQREIYYRTVEMIVGMIESYEEDYEIKEIEVDDYFSGLKEDCNFESFFFDEEEK